MRIADSSYYCWCWLLSLLKQTDWWTFSLNAMSLLNASFSRFCTRISKNGLWRQTWFWPLNWSEGASSTNSTLSFSSSVNRSINLSTSEAEGNSVFISVSDSVSSIPIEWAGDVLAAGWNCRCRCDDDGDSSRCCAWVVVALEHFSWATTSVSLLPSTSASAAAVVTVIVSECRKPRIFLIMIYGGNLFWLYSYFLINYLCCWCWPLEAGIRSRILIPPKVF